MDNRAALGFNTTSLPPPQRAVSGSYALHQQPQRRGPLPSRLNNVRSASQPALPAHLSHLALDPSTNDTRKAPTAALLPGSDQYCRSPEVIDLDGVDDEHGDDDVEDQLQQRPAKRARTDGDAPSLHALKGDQAVVDSAHDAIPGSPLPPLPKQRTMAVVKNTLQRDSRTRQDQAARKAHGLEAPAVATRLPSPKNTADFAPWSGHHPEDVLSETVIKAGYFDKAPGPHSTECHSAKPTIWPNLSQKNNMGLQTLNYLFTSVMEKRLALGRCTAPSTFKPPPRVTVTDTKREAWLRDLANPDIPLRKQSRTIPHGIRGKLLMEQCLGKGISMPRAVWLAKCVGANELRAFRRKGVSGTAAASGESKWIREWTTHVEQFLEGVITSCGPPGWRERMDYAVKLATSFYAEHLLERDHYLDWIVSSFAEATMERVPIWIVLVQLYWKDLMAFSKRGRRLAEATLHFLHQLTQQSTPMISAVKARLHRLVIVLAVTNRGCLVLPRTWRKYKYLLAPGSSAETADASPTTPETPAQNVTKRNERLTAPILKTPQNTRCALLRLYSLLDAVGTDVSIDRIMSSSLSIIPKPSALVHALFDWAASFYRTGLSRVYLATKLIVRLREDGHNTDDATLDYLQGKCKPAIDASKVHMVIAQLVGADGFSPSRYFQWLITSGALSGKQGSDLATGLLSALPINALPSHLHNTRQTLLRRLTHSVDDEGLLLRIQVTLNDLISQSDVRVRECFNRLDLLSSSARSAVTRYMLGKARGWAKAGVLHLQTFCNLREMTERCEDVVALSDLVEMAVPMDDMIFLASIIDTINMHADCFAAIGRLSELRNLVVTRYRVLRSQQSLDRTLILALKLLLHHHPDGAHMVLFLENDLAVCDQQSSMAVCSPASDNLVSMQASALDSDEDIDAVFASGNTMDEQLMQRVFARIVQRAGRPGEPAAHAPSKLCAWWNQLRAVDVRGFEQLIENHMRSCLADGGNAKGFCNVVSTVVASTCLAFNTLLQLAKDASSPEAASSALTALLSDSSHQNGMHTSEVFRYRLLQESSQSECIDLVGPLLVTAMENPKFAPSLPAASKLLRKYLANGHRHVIQAIVDVDKPSPPYLRNCNRLLTDLLHLGTPENSVPEVINARAIILHAGPLSVDHCAAALQFLSKTGHSPNAEDDHDLRDAILEAIAGGCDVWPQLLDGAGSSITTAIYQWSRDKVLASALNQRTDETEIDEESIRRQLDVLDITHHAAKEDDHSQIVAALTEKLKALETQLPMVGMEIGQGPSIQSLLSSLGIVLHLSILYSTFTGSDGEAFKQYQGYLLAALCNLLIHPQLQRHPSTVEYIYDIAASLSEVLPDTALHGLIRTLPLGSNDPRIVSLLGSSSSPDAWLALVTSTPPPGSQQQRILMKQASNQSQQPQQSQMQTPVPSRQPLSAMPKCGSSRAGSHTGQETIPKVCPYPLRRWEIMSDATPMVGENDTSLSLGLFGARKV